MIAERPEVRWEEGTWEVLTWAQEEGCRSFCAGVFENSWSSDMS